MGDYIPDQITRTKILKKNPFEGREREMKL